MYKMPIQREKAARRLAAAVKGHGKLIAAELEPRMARVLEDGEPMPDVAHLLDVLGRVVVRESEGLGKVSDARGREGAWVKGLQLRLWQEAEPRLRRRVVEVRRQMVRFFGAKETSEILLHRGRTPRDLEGLEDLAVFMVRHLPGLRRPTAAGVTVDPAAWAEHLRPALDDYSEVLDQLYLRSDNKADAVKVKQTAMAVFDKTFRRVLRLSELFYELAGLKKLARHLRYRAGRPSVQKKAERTA